MTTESKPLDITNMPELSHLVDELRATQRPRILRRDNEDVALVVPIGPAVPTPMPYNPALAAVLAGLPEDSVVVRTAGALHTDQPFLGYDEEKQVMEIAAALDIVAQWEQ